MLSQVVPFTGSLPEHSASRKEHTGKGLPPQSISRGQCRPFGATVTSDGVNFAVFSRHAEAMDLLLFAEGADTPFAEVPLLPEQHRTGDVWHVFVHGLRPGTLYAYRAHGPFTPRLGHRFNGRVALLDPYARALGGPHPWGERSPFRHRPARLGVVVKESFDWGDDRPPATPWAQTVLYEMHVRGFTRHPSAGVSCPGTFLGACDKLPYLQALGVTAVQLMPVLEFDELSPACNPLTGEPLANYWGYSPLSFFAPKESYASGPGRQGRELKEMVKRFHGAGIEVLLDVVFNHTAEGGDHGPTFGPRGLDNASYYFRDREGHCCDYSGCGNALDVSQAVVRQLILDALVEWVAEYHIDGFRFDLAAVLARGPEGRPQEDAPLLRAIAEHPVLSRVKLIAEPWDAGGLYLQGRFPTWGQWAELNGPFRDDARHFVRGEAGATVCLAKRLSGSLDLFAATAEGPLHSVNFVTCHDGFTLHDLVSYERKQNEANGEGNRDGWDHNFSYNCGVEGPTTNAHVLALRQRQMRNFLVLLFASQGVPLLLMGDEVGRTQLGNNNAYCQDNEVSWLDWSLEQNSAGLLRFTRLMITLRKKYFALSREGFAARVAWHGTQIGEPDWGGQHRTLAMQLRAAPGAPGLCLLFNAHWSAQRFHLPRADGWGRWRRLVDTSLPSPDDIRDEPEAVPLSPADHYVVTSRSIVILMS